MNSQSIRYKRNLSSASEIVAHLQRCDDDFVPPLSTTVGIDAYAHKLAANAERFEAWVDDTLVGLVATYCNDHDRNSAFITNVSVLPQAQGRGVAVKLMQACIGHVREIGFNQLSLEVNDANEAAAALYRKLGFFAAGEREPIQIMRLLL